VVLFLLRRIPSLSHTLAVQLFPLCVSFDTRVLDILFKPSWYMLVISCCVSVALKTLTSSINPEKNLPTSNSLAFVVMAEAYAVVLTRAPSM
jgi:hypothetical protein